MAYSHFIVTVNPLNIFVTQPSIYILAIMSTIAPPNGVRVDDQKELILILFISIKQFKLHFLIGCQPVKGRNYQEIKIQEQVEKLAVGTIPRSMWVILEEDLVDSCKAGDDVTIWLVLTWSHAYIQSD